MKSYKELIEEALNQRAIIDNRQIVDLSAVSPSVLIAFNQACEFMRDLHNWAWNMRTETYVNDPRQNLFPMPYGIVHGVVFQHKDGSRCPLEYVNELTATTGCPSQWTYKWDSEEVEIAPAVSEDCDELSTTTLQYHDKNIACLGNRTEGNLLQRFSLEEDVDKQYLNVPEYIYDAYARCVILKTRVFLNENAQTTIFGAQKEEWQEALYGLMKYAKTPYYKAGKTVL